LDSLVSDLLTLSEVEERGLAAAGPGSPTSARNQVIDLGEIASAAASPLRPQFEQAGIALDLQLDPAPVKGDAISLETAVRNLLDNALRYSERGGSVQVKVSRQGVQAVLSVKDDGQGIPRDAQERIFERFYRVDPARSRESGGTGLGLSIVRHVIEQHGGRVGVESALGLGSTFSVSLPLAPPPRDASDA
jgi:signal transduction histidine kinase